MITKRFKAQAILLYLGAQPPLLRYGLAVLAVIVATIATLHIPVIQERAMFLLFFFAIIETAFWLGRNPGLLAMALSLLSVNALVLLPAWVSKPYDTFILNAGFCILSAVFIITASLYWRLTVALLEKQQDLDYAQTIGQIGNWRMNVQNGELRWSDENYQIFGVPKGAPMTYQTFLSTVHPEDREYVDRKWQAALCGEPYDIEHRLMVAGKVKWVRERAILEFDKKERLVGGFGTTQDITERKHHELLLAQNRQRYEGIIESANNAIISIDANQRILLFNAAAEKMFGCTANEAIGESIERFIPERFRPGHAVHIGAFERTGVTSRKNGELGAIIGLHANGEEFPVEASISQCDINGEKSFTAILRDVTERVRADIALQEQLRLQDQLAKVAATVPGVICSFRLHPDGSASMPYASPVFESIYGFSADLVADDFSPVFARIHPDDISHINATIGESARTLQPWRDSYRYYHPTKGEIWVEGHSMPLPEMDGSILWHGYIQDVTDRKLAETTLRDRESELRLIMDATPALIAYLDTNFRYLRVNAAYQNWFCISSEGILGQEVRQIIGEKAWNIVCPNLERARAGERVSFDQVIPFGTGKSRWVHVSYIPDRDSTGTVKGIVAHIFDIDERKRTEEALRVSQKENKFLADLIRLSSQSVAIGYPDGRIGLVNSAFEELTGYSSLELRRINWATALTPPECYEIERDKLAELQHTGDSVRYEKEYIRKNGARVPIELLVHLVTDSEGKPQFYYAFVNDITERKRAAEAVRASEAFVRGVLNALPEHVVVLDEQGVVTTVNESWERFALENDGRSGDVLVGANYLDVCRRSSAAGDLDARKAIEGLEALFVGQRQQFMMEYPCTTPSGELWFLMHAKRELQELQGVVITHTDITELKHASVALRETQARLSLVVEEVKAGYWDWDLNTNKVYLSSEWKRQIGFDESESLNRWEDWECRLHPDDCAFVMETTENYIAGRQPFYEFEFRLRHKDGSYRWIHSRASLLRDQNNHPYRMMGIDLDVTDFKRTKELSDRRDQMEQEFRLHVASQTVAAIAHELNQPLAAISVYAEVALTLLKTGNQNPQKLSHVMENCALQAQRAGEVIRQLMTVLHKGET
ncbi:MAG: PAS domain S-box protein, partial [Methylovulum sp.]